MGRLATAAGVAANTIYWYFADKDDVLVATLNDVMADAWKQYAQLKSSTRSGRPTDSTISLLHLSTIGARSRSESSTGNSTRWRPPRPAIPR
jgi:AcrR family transcriptional regulator